MNASAPILLVDDSAAESELLVRSLARPPYRLGVKRVPGGQEALGYLRQVVGLGEPPPLVLLDIHMPGGQEALGYLRQVVGLGEPPPLVLLDIHMPGMDGMEVLSAIRAEESFAGLRVVMLTQRPEDRAWLRTQRLGADGYISKPAFFELMGLAQDVGLDWLRPLGDR